MAETLPETTDHNRTEPMEHDFHRELKRQTADFFADNLWTVYQEFPLPDRTIADVLAYRNDAGFTIAEVSPVYSASKAERTFDKYYKWCNKLYLVTADEMTLPAGEGKKLIDWLDKHRNIGLIYLNKRRMMVMRSAIQHNLDEHTTNLLRDRMDRSCPNGQVRVLKPTEAEE